MSRTLSFSSLLRVPLILILSLTGVASAEPAAPAPLGTSSYAAATLSTENAIFIELGDAIERARAANPRLAALASQVDAAHADVRAAKTSYWFTVDAQYTGRESHTFPDPDIPEGSEDLADSFSQEDWVNSLDFNLTQPIPVFGQQRLSVKAAKLALHQAQAAYDLESQRLREQVVTAYFQALLGSQVLALREAEVSRNATTLDQAQAKFDAGAVPQFEVLRANVAYLNARDAQYQAERQAALAVLNFRRLLSTDEPLLPAPVERPTEAWYQDPTLDLAWVAQTALAYALTHRPELRQLALTENQISVATSLQKRRPSLGLLGNLNYSDQDSAFTGSNSHSVLLQLNLPLWDAGRDQAEEDAGEARREQIASESQSLEEVIAVEVSDAVLQLQEAVLRLQTADETLDQATESVRIATLGYDEGVLVFLDLQEAQDGLLAAELNALEATATQAIAEATLLRVLGLEDPDIALAELAYQRSGALGIPVPEGEPPPPFFPPAGTDTKE